MPYIILNKDLNRVRIKNDHFFTWSGNFEFISMETIKSYLEDPYVYKYKILAKINAWLYHGAVYDVGHIKTIIKWYEIYNEEKSNE